MEQNIEIIKLKEAAALLGVSVDTLRRWDKSGKLPALRETGKRFLYYYRNDVEKYLLDLFHLAKNWVTASEGKILPDKYYCPNSAVLQTELMRLEKRLSQVTDLAVSYPLLVAMAGEIGNNSFDHNIGNWSDIAGIFFSYDINKRYIVLADRGQGIYKTLKRIRPELKDDVTALRTAFTDVVSGRAPESRGNGLKFVRQIITGNNFTLFFQSGKAELVLKQSDTDLKIYSVSTKVRGCLAVIRF